MLFLYDSFKTAADRGKAKQCAVYRCDMVK